MTSCTFGSTRWRMLVALSLNALACGEADVVSDLCNNLCNQGAQCGQVPSDQRGACKDQCETAFNENREALYTALEAPAVDSYLGCISNSVGSASCEALSAGPGSTDLATMCFEQVGTNVQCHGRTFEAAYATICEAASMSECIFCKTPEEISPSLRASISCYTEETYNAITSCIQNYACTTTNAFFQQNLTECFITALGGNADAAGGSGTGNSCCGATDTCGWAQDGFCDCNGAQPWDAVDCQMP